MTSCSASGAAPHLCHTRGTLEQGPHISLHVPPLLYTSLVHTCHCLFPTAPHSPTGPCQHRRCCCLCCGRPLWKVSSRWRERRSTDHDGAPTARAHARMMLISVRRSFGAHLGASLVCCSSRRVGRTSPSAHAATEGWADAVGAIVGATSARAATTPASSSRGGGCSGGGGGSGGGGSGGGGGCGCGCGGGASAATATARAAAAHHGAGGSARYGAAAGTAAAAARSPVRA